MDRMPRFGLTAAELESVKTKLRASDEEWKVIGPKLQKVVAARQAADAALDADNVPSADVKGASEKGPRGDGRGGPPGNDAFAGPSNKASGSFGPDGGPPPGFGPGGGPPPGFGPGRGPPPGFGGPDSAVVVALAALRTALADPKTTPQALQEKVADVRAVRHRVQRDWANAQQDLLEMLTADQEAMLVSLGYIE
jgi:hypothetical protein